MFLARFKLSSSEQENRKKGFAKRGEKLKKTDIVYTLITRLELSKLKSEVDKIDKDAFVVMHSIKDVKGGMIKKKPMAW